MQQWNNGKPSVNPSEISPSDAGVIEGWDVGKACQYAINHQVGCRSADKCGIDKCASYVEDAIAAGGGPLKNGNYIPVGSSSLFQYKYADSSEIVLFLRNYFCIHFLPYCFINIFIL